MKKTGVLTYYYKTHNYGGILQSYALPYFLNKQGIKTEQICYVRNDERVFEPSAQIDKIKKNNLFDRLKNKFLYREYIKNIKPNFQYRNENFKKFEDIIPHSEKVYNLASIEETNNIYDAFIVGSDQIWTFRCFNPTFFGEFVSKENKLLSYAASAGKSAFTEKENNYLNEILHKFDAISVREQDLVEALSFQSLKTKIQCVVDPTLLLTDNEWNQVASDRLVTDKYIFCYFLGNDSRLRKLAKKYAKLNKLKLVTIPFANEIFNNVDFSFGDIKIYDAGPSEFISLIKYAEYVFTDSFHATVFSLIYKKQFFSFDRIEHKGMSSRLYSLTNIFDCEERFCNRNDKFTIKYLKSVGPIDYTKTCNQFEKIKTKSIDFLLNNLQ